MATQARIVFERNESDIYDAHILSQWVIQSWTGVGSLAAELLLGAMRGSLLERYICRLTLAYYMEGNIEKAWDEFVAAMHATTHKISTDMCPICYEEIGSGIQLKCEHVYHSDCISKWFDTKTTCPMCRYDIIESYIADT